MVQKSSLEKKKCLQKNGLLNWYSSMDFFSWKNSVDFWHKKLTLKLRFWHFLKNHNSSHDSSKTISFEHVDSWAKILKIRTHHLWNYTTEPNWYWYTVWVDAVKHSQKMKANFYKVRTNKYVPNFRVILSGQNLETGKYVNKTGICTDTWQFHGLVLGLVRLIDAKGIDFALPIWPWGWPT